MRQAWIAVLLVFASAPLLRAQEQVGVPEEPEQAIRMRVGFEAAGLLAKKDFAGVNALTSRYAQTGERTPSGTWKLSMVYLQGFYLLMPDDADFEKNWAHIFELEKEWIAKAPSPAAYITLANLHMNYGWQLGERKKDGTKTFLDHTGIARKILEDNKQLASVDPHWYAVMARVAAAQQWKEKEVRALYAEAVKARPDYYEIHFAVMDALVPYWKDSALGAVAFAHEAATLGKNRPEMYMRIIWHAMLADYVPQAFPFNMPEMHASIEDLVAQYPSSWNKNNMAHIACRAFDKSLTKWLMDKIGDGTELGRSVAVIVSAWDDDPGEFNKCLKWSNGQAATPL